MTQVIENGDLARQSLDLFRNWDSNCQGQLTWSSGEIRDLIKNVFKHYSLVPPTETQMYALYTLFDVDRRMVLDARECVCLIDALFRSVFSMESRDDGDLWNVPLEGEVAMPTTHDHGSTPDDNCSAMNGSRPLSPPQHISPSQAANTMHGRDALAEARAETQ